MNVFRARVQNYTRTISFGYWGKDFHDSKVLIQLNKGFCIKIWLSQSLNRGNMVNMTKTCPHLQTEVIVEFVILIAVRIVFGKTHVQHAFSRL